MMPSGLQNHNQKGSCYDISGQLGMVLPLYACACFVGSFTRSLVCDCHTAHPVFDSFTFFATVRFTPHCHTLFTRSCRLGTDILHTIGLLVCFTHLHRFPRFNLCDPMQSLAMQSLVASCHSLKPIQMTYSHGRQRNRLLRTNYSIFANSGTQPWMTAVPLLCTYYSIQCKTLAVSREDSGTARCAPSYQFNA